MPIPLRLPRLAIGPAAMERRTHEMLNLAFAQSVRYFDAARSYGKAEDFLLSWLEQHPDKAAEVTVGSKWGYTYVVGWQVEAGQHEVKEHSLPALERQWEFRRPELAGPALSNRLPHPPLWRLTGNRWFP